jgi:mono/diheme cytochrome c family protein
MQRPFHRMARRQIRAACVGFVLVLSACGSGNPIGEGEKIYSKRCYSCHGETGAGDGPTARLMGIKPANLQVAIREKSKGELLGTIIRGRQAMPAFGHSLTMAQREAVYQYLHTLPGKKAPVSRGLDPTGAQGLR